jgi:hypothetical protein
VVIADLPINHEEVKPHNRNKKHRENKNPHANEEQEISRTQYRQSSTTDKPQLKQTTTIQNNQDSPHENILARVINKNDMDLNNQAHIDSTQNAIRQNKRHTKPTTQQTKTVGTHPTVAAGRPPDIEPPHANGKMSPPISKDIHIERTNDNNITPRQEHRLEQETLKKPEEHELTMSTPDQPTTSGPNRRRAQRFKKGGHQTQLGSHARVHISQL